MNYIDIHYEMGYYIKITPSRHMNCISVTFPENIIRNVKQETIIYEIDNDKFITYRNNKKVSEIKCAPYAIRLLSAMVLINECANRGIHDDLLRFTDFDSNFIESEQEIYVQDFFRASTDIDVINKEMKLSAYITDISKSDDGIDSIDIPEEIYDGFINIKDYYDMLDNE